MSVQPMASMTAPLPARRPASVDIRSLANAILFFGLLGFGVLIPIALPLYAYLTR